MARHVVRPAVLIILDGWGIAPPGPGNALAAAHTPVYDRLLLTCPHATLRTDGEAVGLMPGQMGNSNVGHLNIGAGRVVYQDLLRITRAAQDGTLERRLRETGVLEAPRLHLLGLFSDGGVHSHIEHWLAVMGLRRGRGETFLHLFLDGRDVPPESAQRYIARLPDDARVASVAGRFYAMDRDRRWDRTEAAYRAVVEGRGRAQATAAEAVAAAYARGETDEFVAPTVVGDYGGAQAGDVFLFLNFRADRARQLTHALVDESFEPFARPATFRVVTMTEYERELPVPVLFPPEEIHDTLGEVLSRAGKAQFRVAETEKYAHVTYFLNGGREEVYAGEERILVPSPKVRTYDQKPEMSAAGVAQAAVQAIGSGRFDFVVMNFANPDMVGHTGVFTAAVQAVEEVDRRLGEVLQAVEAAHGAALVIADHGNVECMVDPATGEPHTAHTTNPVPVILFDPDGALGRDVTVRDGILADVAPTLLAMMGLAQPPAMTGQSLIRAVGEHGHV